MITVFGSINMDLVATAKRLPKPGETVTGESFSTAAGGKGANQALAARRAGASVKMAGATGDDTFSAPALALLHDAGTDLSLVKTVAPPTGTAVILIGEGGENMISVIPAANGEVSEADAARAVSEMSAGDILMLQFEIPAPAIEAALKAAKAKRITTVINTAPLTQDAPRIARLADILIANETEFELLIGKNGLSTSEREDELKALHAETGQTLIVTLGADGVIAMRNGKVFRAAGLKIEPVDTVGAGDTFCGYLAASLDQGLDFEKALKRAAVAGSLACTRAGAQPSIPNARDVDAQV
ncbi:ribokinase [Rhizobium sp. RM]|uniref:ribokinase n=1 Tax=Rhizobium sp. RM TaxID=2748079 RepID=UPI00110E4BE5|nr:ribokinase [Rhizobium sp. RM]NWJ24674.1 ribokinase [Rhizobium sp. RM]TMV16478.1 ribokinase [Rhizobium sp. Td3]